MKEEINNEEIPLGEFTVELYSKDGKYRAYIGSDHGSGYEIEADSPTSCAMEIGDYFEQEVFNNLPDDIFDAIEE